MIKILFAKHCLLEQNFVTRMIRIILILNLPWFYKNYNITMDLPEWQESSWFHKSFVVFANSQWLTLILVTNRDGKHALNQSTMIRIFFYVSLWVRHRITASHRDFAKATYHCRFVKVMWVVQSVVFAISRW